MVQTDLFECISLLAKSEHAHPIRSGQIHPLEAKNGMKTALKNGAYPFKIV